MTDIAARTLETLQGVDRYNRWIFERIRPGLGQRVLEIGCGTGTITQFLADRDLVVGVDVSPEYIREAAERNRTRANVVIRLYDITDSIEELRQYRFDSAVSVNVFEHIDDDMKAMAAVHALLEPGGRFNLLVPSHPRLMSPFDRAIGHYRRYTKAELRSKLDAAAFKVHAIRRSNPVGALGWAVNNCLLRRRQLGGVAIYDRLVPAMSWFDRRLELPIGLSLTAWASKV
ncbi:MAG TPA: methyltransferase [Candidatus Dormibacteraeota bacterium]|nr:methyltransferase [Candidatus Dormibacteraeota bacterium]